ncbi:MAG: histidine kinase N-terminal 7TM domain-containing protein, partial [Dehalococcoidia bacterium]|nr:histidine kinase N-terminal 7TM domain-containing protein [Dehalococcoidia bacterium]
MNLYLTGPAVAFVVNAVLAILVFRRAPRDHAYRLFSLMALLVSLWGLLELLTRTSPDMDIASAWQKLSYITFAFVAALFFNFSLSLNDIRLKKNVLFPLYGSAALLAVLSASDLLVRGTWLSWFGHSQILGPLFPFYALYTYFLISLGIVYLLRLWNNSRDPGRKNQAAYIILAFTALAAGRTADYLALFGTQNYPLGVIGATVFALVTAWSILKHRLMNINFVIRKSLVFLIPLLFITGTSLVLEHLVPAEESGIVPHLVVLLVVILAFLIFTPQAQIFVDKVFYQKRYRHLQALYRYTGQTRTLDEI